MKKIFLLMVFVLGILSNATIHLSAAQGLETKGGISMDEAKQIALEKVNGKILFAKTEEDDGRVIYEIIVQAKDNTTFEVEIDKETGKVLEVEGEDKGEQNEDDRYDN